MTDKSTDALSDGSLARHGEQETTETRYEYSLFEAATPRRHISNLDANSLSTSRYAILLLPFAISKQNAMVCTIFLQRLTGVRSFVIDQSPLLQRPAALKESQRA